MPLPTKSRYTINEAAKFIANATGETVTTSQVIDWGSQGLYGLYMLAYHCHVRYEDDSQISEISGSLVQVHPNATQAATLESGYSMKIDSCLHDGRKCDFVEPGTSPAWRMKQPASFNSTDLILLGAELAAFTATIATDRARAATPDATPVGAAPMGGVMRIDDVVTKLAAMATATAKPKPINPEFVSLGELLQRVQRARAPNLTPTQAAAFLLDLGFQKIQGVPEWRCNSKTRGIVRVDATQATWATDRLKYVFHRGQFESDYGNGASSDYELFGFDRKEFADFLALKVGELLDLFCPMPEPQGTTPSPAPVMTESASGGVEPDKAGTKVSEGSADVPKRETRQAASSPKFSMRLDALIEAHRHEWPSIKTDIKAASDNGLSAAKAGARGWWEELTMEWARANGKLKSAAKPGDSLAQAMHNMGSLPSRKNRLEG